MTGVYVTNYQMGVYLLYVIYANYINPSAGVLFRNEHNIVWNETRCKKHENFSGTYYVCSLLSYDQSNYWAKSPWEKFLVARKRGRWKICRTFWWKNDVNKALELIVSYWYYEKQEKPEDCFFFRIFFLRAVFELITTHNLVLIGHLHLGKHTLLVMNVGL